jgi:uncharacterized membrane protein HdeD (DUF308 family)
LQHTNQSFTQKQPIAFAVITIIGVAALLLGLALIIYAHYHERAYIFLGLGAAGFIGGIAGIIVAGSKVKAALSYGVIALGMMGMIVGFNYLANRYGSAPNNTHGAIVIASSVVAILVGIVGALMAQPKGGLAAVSSVILLGVIASSGIAALIAGTIYLIVLEHPGHAYTLLGAGTLCLVGGVASGIFAQSKARSTLR